VSIYNDIFTDLASLGYLIRQQGDFLENETLPTTFITYFVVTNNDRNYSSNTNSMSEYRVQLILYSKTENLTHTAESIFDNLLKPKGYRKISGRDLPLWKASQHYGYAIDYRKFYQNN